MSNHNLSNRYSSELIESIVNLHQSVQYANLLSKEYDVCASSIKLWIKQSYMKDRNFLSVSEKQFIKENKRLKAKNGILKHVR